MSTPVGTSTGGDFTDEVTVSVPAGTQDGDYMVALVTANDGTGITPPVGWTLVREDLFTTTSGVAMWVYERVAASEPADYTWSWDASHWHFVAIVTWRGYDPIGASAHREAAGVTEIDLPSLVAQPGDLLLAFGFHWGTATKEWDSDDLTEIVNLPRAIIAAYEVQAGGPTPEYTLTASSSGTMGATALLLPAPGNVPITPQERLWSCGFELASDADGVEVDGIGGNPEITTIPELVRSGQAALRCTTNGDTAYVQKWVAASEDGPWYVRAYLRIQELPDVDTVILRGLDDANLSVASVRLTPSGTLQLWDDHETGGGQQGGDSDPLGLDTWYRVELRIGPLNSGAALRLDGTEVATANILTTGENVNRFRFGVCSPATADLVLDDLAVNADQYPGEGRIIHLHPVGPGDAAEWSGTGGDENWRRVSEVTPDDDSSYNEHAVAVPAADRFTVSPCGLVSDAQIRLLQVGARIGSTGTGGDLALTLTAGDTTVTGDTVSAAVDGWVTHDADPPGDYSLTSIAHPDTGEPWTPADLDGVQIGYTTVTPTSERRRVTTLWLLVEYVDGEISPAAPAEDASPLGAAMAVRGMPAIVVEATFAAARELDGVLHLDDPVRGLLDQAVLGPEEAFVDVSRWAREVQVSRGADRITAPVITYDAGTASVVLDNRDRRFDPTNLGGPYVVAGRSQVAPMRVLRIRARWGSTSNLVVNPWFEDSLDGWEPGADTTVERTVEVSAQFGMHSLRIAAGDDAVANLAVATTESGVEARAGDGQTVTLSAYARIPPEAWPHITGLSFVGLSGRPGTDAIPATPAGLPSTPDTWERLVVTTTVAGGETLHGLAVVVHTDGGLAAGETAVYLDGLQVVAKDWPEPWEPPERVYDLVRGYADQWDVAWDDPNDSTTTVTLSDAFKVFGQIRLTAAESPVGGGEDTGARIHRVLDAIGWPAGDRDIATGDTTLQETDLEGTALEVMQEAVEAEIGELYMTPAGKVRFRNRTALFTDMRSRHPVAVFGDGPGEIGYREVVITTDDATLANRVTITRDGGTPQTAEDIESQSEFLVRTYDRSGLLLETDDEALAYAQFVLYQSHEPELRFEQLRLRPLRDRGRVLPVVLGAQIGDRLRIRRRPPGGGLIERDVIIRGVQHEITPGDWQTVFALQSATRLAFFVLDDPTLGRLDENALGY